MTDVVDAVSAEPIPEEPGLSRKGLVQVFTSPARLFEKLKDHPKVLVPMIGIVLVAVISAFLMRDVIGQMQYDQAVERMAERGLSAEAVPSMDTMKLISVASAPLVVLGPLIYAALAMFIGNFLFGGEAKYKDLLAVAAYSELLYYAGAIVMVPLVLAKKTLFVSLSLAALVPDPASHKALWAVLSKFGVFNIWEIVVAGIGFAIVYSFPRNKGYYISVITFGITSVLLALVGGLFQ